MFANHHQFPMLVVHFHQFRHQSEIRLLMVFLFLDGNGYANGIIDKNGPGKTQVIVAIRHRRFIDHIGRKAYGHRKDQGAVGDPFFKRLRFAPFLVHVVREKIARLPGMNYNIGLCDRSSFGTTHMVQFKIFKKCNGAQSL